MTMDLGTCEVRRMKLVDMTLAPFNPRKISDVAFEGLGNSIERFGLMSLIVWNERSGHIVGGHQRYRKLVDAGESETDVVVVHLNDDDEIALNILLNSREIRGDFTKEVLGVLRKAEVQIGTAFNDLLLNDLHERMRRIRWEPSSKADRSSEPPPSSPPSPPPPPPSPPSDTGEPDAIIVCPKCSSKWRMVDNKVIQDATQTQNSEQVDGGKSQVD